MTTIEGKNSHPTDSVVCIDLISDDDDFTPKNDERNYSFAFTDNMHTTSISFTHNGSLSEVVSNTTDKKEESNVFRPELMDWLRNQKCSKRKRIDGNNLQNKKLKTVINIETTSLEFGEKNLEDSNGLGKQACAVDLDIVGNLQSCAKYSQNIKTPLKGDSVKYEVYPVSESEIECFLRIAKAACSVSLRKNKNLSPNNILDVYKEYLKSNDKMNINPDEDDLVEDMKSEHSIEILCETKISNEVLPNISDACRNEEAASLNSGKKSITDTSVLNSTYEVNLPSTANSSYQVIINDVGLVTNQNSKDSSFNNSHNLEKCHNDQYHRSISCLKTAKEKSCSNVVLDSEIQHETSVTNIIINTEFENQQQSCINICSKNNLDGSINNVQITDTSFLKEINKPSDFLNLQEKVDDFRNINPKDQISVNKTKVTNINVCNNENATKDNNLPNIVNQFLEGDAKPKRFVFQRFVDKNDTRSFQGKNYQKYTEKVYNCVVSNSNKLIESTPQEITRIQNSLNKFNNDESNLKKLNAQNVKNKDSVSICKHNMLTENQTDDNGSSEIEILTVTNHTLKDAVYLKNREANMTENTNFNRWLSQRDSCKDFKNNSNQLLNKVSNSIDSTLQSPCITTTVDSVSNKTNLNDNLDDDVTISQSSKADLHDFLQIQKKPDPIGNSGENTEKQCKNNEMTGIGSRTNPTANSICIGVEEQQKNVGALIGLNREVSKQFKNLNDNKELNNSTQFLNTTDNIGIMDKGDNSIQKVSKIGTNSPSLVKKTVKSAEEANVTILKECDENSKVDCIESDNKAVSNERKCTDKTFPPIDAIRDLNIVKKPEVLQNKLPKDINSFSPSEMKLQTQIAKTTNARNYPESSYLSAHPIKVTNSEVKVTDPNTKFFKSLIKSVDVNVQDLKNILGTINHLKSTPESVISSNTARNELSQNYSSEIYTPILSNNKNHVHSDDEKDIRSTGTIQKHSSVGNDGNLIPKDNKLTNVSVQELCEQNIETISSSDDSLSPYSERSEITPVSPRYIPDDLHSHVLHNKSSENDRYSPSIDLDEITQIKNSNLSLDLTRNSGLQADHINNGIEECILNTNPSRPVANTNILNMKKLNNLLNEFRNLKPNVTKTINNPNRSAEFCEKLSTQESVTLPIGNSNNSNNKDVINLTPRVAAQKNSRVTFENDEKIKKICSKQVRVTEQVKPSGTKDISKVTELELCSKIINVPENCQSFQAYPLEEIVGQPEEIAEGQKSVSKRFIRNIAENKPENAIKTKPVSGTVASETRKIPLMSSGSKTSSIPSNMDTTLQQTTQGSKLLQSSILENILINLNNIARLRANNENSSSFNENLQNKESEEEKGLENLSFASNMSGDFSDLQPDKTEYVCKWLCGLESPSLDSETKLKISNDSNNAPAETCPLVANPTNDQNEVCISPSKPSTSTFPVTSVGDSFVAPTNFSVSEGEKKDPSSVAPEMKTVLASTEKATVKKVLRSASPEKLVSHAGDSKVSNVLPVMGLHPKSGVVNPINIPNKTRVLPSKPLNPNIPVGTLSRAASSNTVPINNASRVSQKTRKDCISTVSDKMIPLAEAKQKECPATGTVSNIVYAKQLEASVHSKQPPLINLSRTLSSHTVNKDICKMSKVDTIDFTSRSIGACLVPKQLKSFVGYKTMDTENVMLLMLEWRVSWLGQQLKIDPPPPICKVLRKVVNSYSGFSEYYNTYFPLMLLDTWHRIFISWRDSKDASPYLCEISSHLIIGQYLRFDCNTLIADHPTGLFPTEGKLSIITFGTNIQESNIKVFGYLTHVRSRAFNPRSDSKMQSYKNLKNGYRSELKVLTLTIRVVYNLSKCDLTLPISVQMLCNIKTIFKQNDALLYIKKSPFYKNILNPVTEIQSFELTSLDSDPKVVFKRVCDITRGISISYPIPSLVIVQSKCETDRQRFIPLLIENLKAAHRCKVLLCERTVKSLNVIADSICLRKSLNMVIVTKRCEINKHLLKYSLNEQAAAAVKLDKDSQSDNMLVSNARKDVLQTCDVTLVLIRNSHEVFLNEAIASSDRIPHLCCIIDEASLCTETDTLIPVMHGISKLILIGDPNADAKVLSKTAIAYQYNKSFFHRVHNLHETSK